MAALRSTMAGLERGIWRGIDVFRLLALCYAASMVWMEQDVMTRPWLAWAVLLALAAWSCWLATRQDRSAPALMVDVALACGAILATLAVHPPAEIAGGATTIPSMYAAAPVAASAVRWGLRGALGSSGVVTVANLGEVGRPTGATIYNTLLLVVVAACLGICMELGRRSQAAIDEGLRLQAEAAERERIARVVHDGVLQTLALIHRRGAQAGGEAAALGALAAESERDLRSLVTAARPRERPDTATSIDVRAALLALAGPGVEVVAPAEAVPVPSQRGHELVAAVAACLDNVARHAGPGARAWVLLDDLGPAIEVTVRDDGCGIPAGRLDQAERDGRLGVASSVRGRLRDLGGETTIRSTVGRGTTVRLCLPAQEE